MRRALPLLARVPDADCARLLHSACGGVCRRVGVSSKDAGAAVLKQLAQWRARPDEYDVGADTCRAAFDLLLPLRLDKACLRVWELHVRAQGRQLDKRGYEKLVKVVAASNNTEALVNIWEEMRGFNIEPTRPILHAIARCVANAGHREVALKGMLDSRDVLDHGGFEATQIATVQCMASLADAYAYLDSVDVAPPYSRAMALALLRVPASMGDPAAVETLIRRFTTDPAHEVLKADDDDMWTLLLNAYAEAGDWMGAQLAYGRMAQHAAVQRPRHATVVLRCAAGEVAALWAKGVEAEEVRVVVAAAERIFVPHRPSTNTEHRLMTAMMRVYAEARARDAALALYRQARRAGATPTEPFMQQARRVLGAGDLGVRRM